MDQGTFRRFKRLIERCGFYRRRKGERHSDGAILAVALWAALHDRAIDWACQRSNWTPGLWRGTLPSQSCMSRRMRTPRFQAQQQRLERLARTTPTPTPTSPTTPTNAAGLATRTSVRRGAIASSEPPPIVLVACIDAKPLPVAWHSGDPHAGKGRGAGALALGYKLHAIISARGHLLAWRLAPLSVDEKAMAARMIREIQGVCYLVGDSFYNSNLLFRLAEDRGAQLVAPRKRSHVGTRPGNHDHHPDRLRSIDLLEDGLEPFALDLLMARRAIERFFANLTNFGGGLTTLPPWVRTYPRVLAWTTNKLTIAHLRQRPAHDTLAA